MVQSIDNNSHMRNTVARAEAVTMRYGTGENAVTALDNVTVAIPGGQWTTVMGASGSGKSTLLHVLAGLTVPTSGQVFLGDRDITRLSENARARLRRTDIGVVFQEFNLVPVLNVKDNLLLPSRLAHRVDKDWFEHVVATLGLGDRLRHLPRELSGGQRQRVAVGRAVLTRPRLILADEPTGNLDSKTSRSVLSMFRSLVDDLGQTLFMITHDAFAAEYGENTLHMQDGRLTA
ncbi:ABC transporter ATP-binding protein [Corynebacterium glucuronolyticum]|uniref:ABC transporter ATP-binding protein n=1 Tax=Corynebacterium glucuronolyticum TaxID=39791 RepID=UPI00191E0A07|nr:ABC transporter ATP-binding protein [Corynebacterium glucuronolyticum]QQU88320.1 ABC transporter ATP-binding protein [Corynebacterium glucuronolyticum]